MSELPDPLANATPVELAIAKLELKPGDVLVLKINRMVSHDVAIRIQEWAKGVVPGGAKVMLLDSTADISVLRAEPGEGR
jgi:hypothetical protein